MRGRSGTVGRGSTAAVLWLMILLVFLPIAAAHVVARFAEWRAEANVAVSLGGGGQPKL